MLSNVGRPKAMDNETQHYMRSLQDAIRQVSEQQRKLAVEMHQRQQAAAAEKMVETLVKILSSSYDKAIAYNNVVIVAGYASFFAIWAATKPALSGWVAISAALLMVTSATIFVLFELFKMIHSSRSLMRLQDIAKDDNARKDPTVFQEKVKAFENSQRIESLRFVRVWVAVLGATVSTAVTAIGLLVFNFVSLLFIADVVL